MEKTKLFLEEKCAQSVPNSVRRKARGRYPLPNVAATRTLQLHAYIKSEIPHQVKSADKDLAKIQTFVLDALAPLVSILDLNNKYHRHSFQDTIDAISPAVELIGNTNARISCLRHEKVTLSLNKTLLPLCQEDGNFKSAATALFGPEFARMSKEHIDQVRAMWSGVPSGPSKQFFDLPHPQKSRGGYHQKHGRSGASSYFQGAAETVSNSMPTDYRATSKPDSKTRANIQYTDTSILQFGRNSKKYVNKSISMHECGLYSYESQISRVATAFPRKLGSHYKGSVGSSTQYIGIT